MNRQVIKNRIRKVLAYSITTVIFLIISGILLLQMPQVQNFIISRLLRDFSGVSGFQTHVQDFHLLWFDRLKLDGVSVVDPEGNEMITAKSININFELTHLLENNNVHIDGIILDSANVFLTIIDESDTSRDLNINTFIYRINQLSASKKTGGKSPRINIGEAVLNQCQFKYVNQYRDTVAKGFDYNHFVLDVDEGQLRNFLVLGDTTQFDVTTLLVKDRETQFEIRQLSTFFRISQNSMEFNGLHLKAGKSTITDTVQFTYERQRDLNDFVSKVNVYAHLDNTVIFPEDLALFAPGTERIGQPITVNGIAEGRVNKFTVKEMSAVIGNSRLMGALDMDGLPDVNETFIILNLQNSQLLLDDFGFLLSDKILNRMRPVGPLTLNGQFLGYPTDFVANGDFVSRLGRIRSDINFKVNEVDFDKSTYNGRLVMSNFDIGRYLRDTTTFQKVSLDGNLKGMGLTMETANFTLNGKVTSLGIKGYNYRNIITNARFASEFFSGFLKINDPNLEFSAQGSVDLRKGKQAMNIQASLDTAFLHNLNLTTKNIFLQTKLDVDLKGLKLDSLEGNANFKDFKILYDGQELALESIFLNSRKDEDTRFVNLYTTLADVQLNGNFLFTDISKDIDRLLYEIKLNIRNDKGEIARYYEQKHERPKNYQAAFEIDLKDVTPLSALLQVDLDLAANTKIEGSFTSGYTTIFRAYTLLDTVDYKNNRFYRTEAEITASKIADSTSVLAVAFLNSEKQALSSGLLTENLIVEGVWNQNHIDFDLNVDQTNEDNYLRLQGSADFLRDSTQLKLLPSTIHILERDWMVHPENEVTIHKKEWRVSDLALSNGDQSVRVDGRLSEDPSEILNLKIQQLELGILNVLTNKKFSGIMNANVELTDYYNNPSIQNDISIKDLTVDEFLVGDITGNNKWDNSLKKFDVNFFIDRKELRIVNLIGNYTPSVKESPLNITARFDKANLKIAEPFLDDIFKNIDGTITGDYKITGTLDRPLFDGEGKVNNGQIMINYLGTLYRFTGIIGLKPTSLYFKNIELTDTYKNNGSLDGAITHNNFSNMVINLNANFRTFQVLNTTAKDNSLFYGQGFATGDVNFYGPLSNLKISSTARTEKNTRIYIPIGGASSIEKKDFINFVDFNDSTYIKQINKVIEDKVNLTGITFELNLDVTPEAYCEIIFDIKSGDIIRGRGNGDLKLQLDTKGEFNMFGQIEFTEGWYNFTLYDVINKEFEIERGSQITWYGDPYAAILNIDASYNQLASFAPILNDPNMVNAPELRRKYPAQVLLSLEGPMLSPQISFDIVATELPQNIYIEGVGNVQLDFMFNVFKNKMDEQELKKQVFSLIVLRRFSPPESFNTSGSLYNSVSELLSNQLSYWMSQVDENLEIDVDLGTMDQEAFNTFQLRLSYTFLNGRLRVTRDGTFGNNDYNNTAENRNNLASIAGDWTVDYYLTADGKFKVKMYNRTNYNMLSTTLNNQNYFTTGVSLQHIQSFNEIKDLWSFARKNKSEKRSNNAAPVNDEAIKEDEETGQ